MRKRSNRNLHRHSGEAGLTLLEILVSMTVFTVVSASVFGLLKVGQTTRTAISNNVELTKTTRLGLNLFGRDTANVGLGFPYKNATILKDNKIATLLGIPPDVGTTADKIPPILAGNNVNPNTFNTTPGVMTDQVTFFFKDVSFNPVGPAGRQSSKKLDFQLFTAGTNVDELTLNTPADVALCRVNDVFLIAGQNGAFTLGMVTGINSSTRKLSFATGDKLGLNNPFNSPQGELRSMFPTTTGTFIVRVKMVTYFVTPQGVLTRREFGNVKPPDLPSSGYVDEPLVYGVEDFQLKYIMNDATYGAVLDNPGAGPDGIAGSPDDTPTPLTEVSQIRVTITARTTEVDSRGVPVRATQTSTFATKNLGFDVN
jgi:type II secretory pathway pseudopilin PulG